MVVMRLWPLLRPRGCRERLGQDIKLLDGMPGGLLHGRDFPLVLGMYTCQLQLVLQISVEHFHLRLQLHGLATHVNAQFNGLLLRRFERVELDLFEWEREMAAVYCSLMGKSEYPEQGLGLAFIHSAGHSDAFSRFSRYESALDRALYRAIHELEWL